MTNASSTKRSQAIGGAVIAMLIVIALVWLTRGGDAPGDKGTGSPGQPATTAQPSANTTNGSPGSGPATDPDSGLAFVDESQLPPQARDTLALIQAGGPYPYPRNDNVVYHNNNKVLPKESDGYYNEYTVVTPGSAGRGARRIIAGKNGEKYYTADHYDSFRRIREGG